MRTKSSVRIVMTIIMKVVPLTRLRLSAGICSYHFILQAGVRPELLKFVLIKHPPGRWERVLFDES